MTESELETLKRVLLGSALAGGATAGIVGLARNTTEDENDAAAAAALEAPAVKRIKLPARLPAPEKAASLEGYAAPAAGVLTAAGVYALVSNALRARREKQLQEQLGEAKDKHLQAIATEAEATKAASTGWIIPAGVSSVALLALATGLLGNRMLERRLPRGKLPESQLRPRLVVEQEDETKPESAKQASIDTLPYETEFLLRSALALEDSAPTVLTPVLKAAAAGKIDELRQAAVEGRFIDSAEGIAANCKNASRARKEAAITWLAHDEDLAPSIGAIAAASCFARCPTQFALAKSASMRGHDDELLLLAINTIGAHRKSAAFAHPLYTKAASVAAENAPKGGINIAGMLGEALRNGEDAESEDGDEAEGMEQDDGEDAGSSDGIDNPTGIPKPVVAQPAHVPTQP